MSTYSEKLEGSAKNMVHAKLQKRSYDKNTGKPNLKPFIQIFSIPEFNNFARYSDSQGWDVEILHDPRTELQKAQVADINDIELEQARAEYKTLFGKEPHRQKSLKSLRKELTAYYDQDEVLKSWQKAMGVKTVPPISKDEMIEDIRKIKLGEKTVAQEQAIGIKEIEAAVKKAVKEHAKIQANYTKDAEKEAEKAEEEAIKKEIEAEEAKKIAEAAAEAAEKAEESEKPAAIEAAKKAAEEAEEKAKVAAAAKEALKKSDNK